jgi:putative transposase
MIERNKGTVSLSKQCELMDINRSRLYYKPEPIDDHDIVITNEMRDIYQESPFFGYRRIHATLRARGATHNRKKTQRLMRLTGLQAIYPRRKTTISNRAHKKYPYLLKDVNITCANQAWQTDITYIKLRNGFGYLVCLIDIFSRRVMGWAFSPFLDTQLCLEALSNSLTTAKAGIINSDQGCQFTSEQWIEALTNENIQISMDGKGRWIDNKYIERLWRSIKYEAVYLHSLESMNQAREVLKNYISFYNERRPHQSLGYKTPDQVYFNDVNRMLTLDQLNQDKNVNLNRGGSLLSQIQPVFLS